MEEGIPYVDEIFSLLREEMRRFSPPVVSHIQWKRIRQTPFTVLVSCILSLRTKDEVTAEASVRLLKRYDTPEKLSKLSVEEIESLIYPVGFYHTKARRLKEIAKILVEKYGGRVPDSFEELL
ncbi:MAG TPA: endonuclease III, partial [Thermoplasmatales archaeon]|nr:endonuclease III [Thermoplasmatales archaeon]